MPNLLLMSFCTLVFVGQYEPLPEMVKGVMLIARMVLAPYDFTQTWVNLAFIEILDMGLKQWESKKFLD
ncbi:hypothetical protein BHM03_00013626 [Ensete ventricosum]|nr:hypothetical protein BHM03_00013626 [Ensete ventricosum]